MNFPDAPPPPTLPQSAENATGLRIVATIIDALVFVPVYFVFVMLFGESETGDGSFSFNLSGLPFVLFILLTYGYSFVMEGLRGQTLGKMATKIYVMTEDGRQPEWSAILIRSLLRIVDSLPFFYLIGFICAAVTSKHQRIGDIAAKTIVAKKPA